MGKNRERIAGVVLLWPPTMGLRPVHHRRGAFLAVLPQIAPGNVRRTSSAEPRRVFAGSVRGWPPPSCKKALQASVSPGLNSAAKQKARFVRAYMFASELRDGRYKNSVSCYFAGMHVPFVICELRKPSVSLAAPAFFVWL